MNLDAFQDQVKRQGLARSNRWVIQIQPPSGLSGTNKLLSNFISSGGNRINVNLPGLDAIDRGVAALNDLNVDLGPVNVGTNFSVPTLGAVLTNQGKANEALNLFCNSCTIPSRDMSNLNWSEYGEERALGVKHQHQDVDISYYMSEDMRERAFFEDWQDLIFNSRTKQHGYYRDYVSRIDIIKYDAGWQNQTAIYRLKEVYPTTVAGTELSMETGLAQLQVTFKMRNYEKIL